MANIALTANMEVKITYLPDILECTLHFLICKSFGELLMSFEGILQPILIHFFPGRMCFETNIRNHYRW